MPKEMTRPWKQTPVLSLIIITFISSATVWAAVPYLPIFLTELDNDIPASLIGVAVAASSLGMLCGQYPMARLATKMSIRTFIVANLLLEGISLLGTVIAAMNGSLPAILTIIALRFITGIARAGLAQATRAAVRKTSVIEQRSEVYGLVGAADIAGITLGTFLAGLIAYSGVSMVFVAGAIACAACIPLALSLPRVAPGQVADPAQPPATTLSGIRPILLPLAILLFFTVASTVLIGTYNSAWGPYLRDRGASEGEVGFLFALFTIPFIVIAPLFGRWAKTTRRRVFGIIIGTALAVAAALAYPVLTWMPIVIVAELLAASGAAAAEPSLDALVSDISDDEEAQSKIFGIAGTVTSGISAASAIMAGFLMPTGVGIPFLVAGIIAAVTLLLGIVLIAVSRTTLERVHQANSDIGSTQMILVGQSDTDAQA